MLYFVYSIILESVFEALSCINILNTTTSTTNNNNKVRVNYVFVIRLRVITL